MNNSIAKSDLATYPPSECACLHSEKTASFSFSTFDKGRFEIRRRFLLWGLGALCTPFIQNPKFAWAEVYLEKEAALDLVLGKEGEKQYHPKTIPEDLKADLENRGLLPQPSATEAHFFICKVNETVTGYALIDNEIGKHLPITYIVGITPEGKVSRVEMLVFREVRGWEARERGFLQQFEQKTIESDIAIGSGIKNVTGATLSSRAISKGVERALLMWGYFFGMRKT